MNQIDSSKSAAHCVDVDARSFTAGIGSLHCSPRATARPRRSLSTVSLGSESTGPVGLEKQTEDVELLGAVL